MQGVGLDWDILLKTFIVFLGDFVIGRVIRAVSQSWHPKCFKCVSCHCELADVGFVKNQGR